MTQPTDLPSRPDQDDERLASQLRRERLLDRIAREREAFRAKDKELGLERLRLANAQATRGYRTERAIRSRLHAIRTLIPGRRRGFAANPASATNVAAKPDVPAARSARTAGAPPSVAIHIGAPTWAEAARWGDLPFAQDVQASFVERGWAASIHVAADRDSNPAVQADVALHIAGIRVPPVRPGQTSVLWIISHPDSIRRELCLAYDLIGVASDPFLHYLEDWLGTAAPPMIALHQATNPGRFFPEPGGPAHQVLFVGSARNGRRPFLDALAETNHELAVYGRNWTADLLDPKVLRGEWIPNEELHRYYASARIVLSDSWTDMRDEGFISNRIYDALASGAFVISEVVPGIDQEFDGAVVTYRQVSQLVGQVDHYLAHPDGRAEQAARGRTAVLARHTFENRIDAIIAAVAPLLNLG